MLEATRKLISELPEDERKRAGDIDSRVDSGIIALDSPWFPVSFLTLP